MVLFSLILLLLENVLSKSFVSFIFVCLEPQRTLRPPYL